jgi:hypothetical protein
VRSHGGCENWVGTLGVWWSNVVCATLRKPDPKSPSRIAETLTDGLDADSLFYDLHPHPERAADLESPDF